MKKVLIIGGGDLAKQINHYLENYDDYACVVGFVDDTIKVGSINFGKTCLGSLSDIAKLYLENYFDYVILGVGYRHMLNRMEIFDSLIAMVPFYSFVHPSSFIDSTCVIGSGVVVGPCVTLNQNVRIGNNVFIYDSVTICHDSEVKDHSFLAPSVTIAGFSTIGSCCFLGVGSVISNNLLIVNNVSLGAASLVIKNITEEGVYIGNPVKKIIN